MFTIDQIKAAHSKVKSGADFPRYISEISKLGVARYLYDVSDGHTNYSDRNGKIISAPVRYDTKNISPTPDFDRLKAFLKVHQSGGSDFLTFCSQAAECGVNSWEIDIAAMTCTYFDAGGNALLVEEIPKS